MVKKPTYGELEQRIKQLEEEVAKGNRSRVLGSGLLFFVNDPMQPGQSGLA